MCKRIIFGKLKDPKYQTPFQDENILITIQMYFNINSYHIIKTFSFYFLHEVSNGNQIFTNYYKKINRNNYILLNKIKQVTNDLLNFYESENKINTIIKTHKSIRTNHLTEIENMLLLLNITKENFQDEQNKLNNVISLIEEKNKKILDLNIKIKSKIKITDNTIDKN